MAPRKGGDIIAEFLVKEKIPYVFGICGHGNVGLLDSLYDVRDRIKLVSPRHEQTAAHMADGFFRVSHRPAATLTSTGPGSANLIMALAVAQTDSSAVFSITANVPTSQFNRGAVPGAEPPLPGRLQQRHQAGGEALVPADAGGDAAARHAPGGHHHDQRPARARSISTCPTISSSRAARCRRSRPGTAITAAAAAPARPTWRAPWIGCWRRSAR